METLLVHGRSAGAAPPPSHTSQKSEPIFGKHGAQFNYLEHPCDSPRTHSALALLFFIISQDLGQFDNFAPNLGVRNPGKGTVELETFSA